MLGFEATNISRDFKQYGQRYRMGVRAVLKLAGFRGNAEDPIGRTYLSGSKEMLKGLLKKLCGFILHVFAWLVLFLCRTHAEHVVLSLSSYNQKESYQPCIFLLVC